MFMRLRPILALSFVLAWLPSLGHALGLGEITLTSGLNQPMVAEIELLQMRDLGPNEILPSLASQEDFERAGVSRDFFLTDMRFEVKSRPDGSAYVQVTTRKPVREPFVNFLMEVLWPAGRLLREYTLLMDPPVYADKVAEAVKAPVAPVAPPAPQASTVQRAPVPPPLPRPVRPEIQDPVTTVRSVTGTPPPLPVQETEPRLPPDPVYDPAPRPEPAPVATPAPVSTPAATTGEIYEEDTYTTQANDALWNIATLWRPSQEYTIQETMIAIQRKNPEAFNNGNINELRKGQVLRAPSAEEVRDVTRADAVAEVKRQERLWRQRLTARQGVTQEVDQPVISDAQPTKVFAPEDGSTGGVLRLGAGDVTGDGASGASGDGSGGTGMSASELENELDRVRAEKLEAESRVSELDALLTQNDSIISLQNEQIARLRERLREIEQQANPELGAGPEDPILGAVPGEAPVSGDGQTAPVPGESPEVTPPVDPSFDPNTGETPVINQTDDPIGSTDESSPLDAIYENPIYVGIAVGALVVIALIFFIFRRREDDDDYDLMDEDLEGFDESEEELLTAENEVPLSDIDEDEAAGVGQLLDDQLGDPSDVISEADIFMAYGRFPEAIKLLQSAIDNDPSHPEMHLKLLELYAETKDEQNFVACEAQVQSMPFYPQVADRIAKMRQDYEGEMPPAAGPEMAAVEEDELVLPENDFGESLDLDDAFLDEAAQPELPDDDFGLSAAMEPELELPDPEAASDLQSLADLESSLTADFSQQPDLELGQDDDLGLDEGFDPNSLAADLDDVLGGDGDLETDVALPTADLDFAGAEEPDYANTGDDLADLAADLDLAFDEPEPPSVPAVSEAPAANVPDNDFMADADEAATKLDLARAYIDMGDRAGARDILDEVVQEGNAEQQEEAKALLKKVG